MKNKNAKQRDIRIFWILIIVSFLIGIYFNDSLFKDYKNYSDIVTFLSIMIGFQVASLSILLNTPLKKNLYDRKIKQYETELHRLRDCYKWSLFFCVVFVCIFLIFPDENIFFCQKQFFILPCIAGAVYFFYKLISDLLKIFVYPTNF